MLAHIAKQPSHPEDKFWVLVNLQWAQSGQAGEHVRWAAIEPRQEEVAPCVKRSNARRLAHLSPQMA